MMMIPLNIQQNGLQCLKLNAKQKLNYRHCYNGNDNKLAKIWFDFGQFSMEWDFEWMFACRLYISVTRIVVGCVYIILEKSQKHLMD